MNEIRKSKKLKLCTPLYFFYSHKEIFIIHFFFPRIPAVPITRITKQPFPKAEKGARRELCYDAHFLNYGRPWCLLVYIARAFHRRTHLHTLLSHVLSPIYRPHIQDGVLIRSLHYRTKFSFLLFLYSLLLKFLSSSFFFFLGTFTCRNLK